MPDIINTMTSEEQLLKDLMLIPSPSGSEVAIGEFIFALLSKNGFKVEKNYVDKTRFNVVAKVGSPKVYFSAHMDTVASVLDYSETKTHILGRGSCDTKGSIACMITAGITAKGQGLTNFGLIFTVGEETSLDGAESIIKSGLSVPFVVVGEPTSLEIVNGHFGILVLTIMVRGKAAHSSMPEKGVNAIDTLVNILTKVKTLELGDGTLMSVVKITGGIADNIIPADASAMLSFRVSPTDKTNYPNKIKALLEGDANVQVQQEIKSVYCDIPSQLSFIKKVKTVKYLTELSFYKTGIVLGPGDIKYAHGLEEKVPRKELAEAVKIYTQIIKNYV